MTTQLQSTTPSLPQEKKTRNRGKKGRKRKKKALQKQQKRCYYCGGRLIFKLARSKEESDLNYHRRKIEFEATWDHKIPRSRGGGNGLANLVLCCHRCNNDKSNLLTEEYREVLIRRGVKGFWGDCLDEKENQATEPAEKRRDELPQHGTLV